MNQKNKTKKQQLNNSFLLCLFYSLIHSARFLNIQTNFEYVKAADVSQVG